MKAVWGWRPCTAGCGISAVAVKRYLSGSFLTGVGYMLSPLSFWNDLYVNFPLAYAGGWLAGLFHKQAFLPALAFTYWLTNVAGLVLMHKGIGTLAGVKAGRSAKGAWLKDLAVATGYTLILALLAWAGVIRPVGDYF